MQGLAAAILCRAGPVLEALRPGGTVPQANPTTPSRRQREPSPSTPGDNKRQSRRLKAGQQAGLTLGSLPVSASDNLEVRTPTQLAGETVELRGGTLSPEPWARHCMEISDRPTILPITHGPNLSDKVLYLQMAFKQRPLRDGKRNLRSSGKSPNESDSWSVPHGEVCPAKLRTFVPAP